jgi:hypothetical protein
MDDEGRTITRLGEGRIRETEYVHARPVEAAIRMTGWCDTLMKHMRMAVGLMGGDEADEGDVNWMCLRTRTILWLPVVDWY